MSTESKDFDPYAVVLADLRAKREQIDQAIQAIEGIRGALAPPAQSPAQGSLADEPGAFLGMSISEATRKLLLARKKALTNTEIAAGLQAGGLVLNPNDPINTVGSVLTRRFNQTGDIVRVDRGTWGLKEWYPGRSFKTAKGNGYPEPKSSASEPEQPLTPDNEESLV